MSKFEEPFDHFEVRIDFGNVAENYPPLVHPRDTEQAAIGFVRSTLPKLGWRSLGSIYGVRNGDRYFLRRLYVFDGKEVAEIDLPTRVIR